MTLKIIAQEALIQTAYEHVKNRRKNSHANADIWHTATHWHAIKQEIIAKLNTGTYQLDLVKNHILKNKRMVAYWRSPDAIVLKAIAITLTAEINKQSHMRRVKHLKGNGGIKAAVREAYELSQNPKHFVYKTDVKNYFQTINHKVLLTQLKTYTQDPDLLNLIKNYCERVNVIKGICHHVKETSIPQGCSLAPVLGAIYLETIEKETQKRGIPSIRYMDDILIISEKRWPLKHMVKKLYQILDNHKQTLRPEKTWMSRIAKGYTFCGYQIQPPRLSISKITLQRFLTKVKELLQDIKNSKTTSLQYIKRWIRWSQSGIIPQSRSIKKIYL